MSDTQKLPQRGVYCHNSLKSAWCLRRFGGPNRRPNGSIDRPRSWRFDDRRIIEQGIEMNKSISFLLGTFGYSGGSMVLYGFMDRLCERGYKVYAISPQESLQWQSGLSRKIIDRFKHTRFRDSFRHSIASLVRRSPALEKAARILQNKVEKEPVERVQWITNKLIENWIPTDITVSTYCTTAFAGYALSERTLPLYYMQSYEELFFEDELSRKIARLTYFLPLGLVANSKWLQTQVREIMGRDSSLLNPAIDTNIFRPHVDLGKKFRYDSNISIVSYYGQAKLKNWDDAVEAMRMVFRKTSDRRVQWIVFGGVPPLMPDVPVKFVGRVFGEALARFYSSGHILFMNSWFESFPLPPLEAMACGTAVITIPVGTDDYALNHENSLVVPSKSPGELAEAILKLIEDPKLASRLAESGIQTARRFTWDKATDNMEAILEKELRSFRPNRFTDIFKLIHT